MRNGQAKVIALGGILAAAAMVIMCLGGLVPFATYVCPMLCTIAGYIVLRFCGRKIACVWFVTVAVLSLLMSPDKEAAAVFVALGYYPIIKPVFERSRLSWLWKLLLFNGSIVLLYMLLIRLFGLAEIASDFEVLGKLGLVVMLLMGNAVFILLDMVLNMLSRKLSGK